LLPLAIAFAEGENADSWYWSLERLKNMVVQDVQNVCVIHNKHKDGSQERYRVPLWPDVKSKRCTRHMKANFHSQFKNKALSKLFEWLCEQTLQNKFDAI
jgi:transposase-like protein